MNFFTFVNFLFLAQICSANYTGIWKGEGTLSNTDGQSWYCDEISISIEQKIDHFKFGKFRYACGDLAFNFTPPDLYFDQNGETTWKEQKIGRFTEKSVDFLFKLQNEGDFARYSVFRDGPTLSYTDEQIGPNKTIVIKAQLKLIPQ